MVRHGLPRQQIKEKIVVKDTLSLSPSIWYHTLVGST